MSSITPGIYYGADGFRSFTEDGKYAQIKDGVISSTESITIGATGSNHMVLSENTGAFKLNYLNSSGAINTSLEFGSGGNASGRFVFLPATNYTLFGGSDLSVDVYLKKLIPWLCTKYAHREHDIFIGRIGPGAQGFVMLSIYNTSQLSGGVP